jgi:hypothetical protein
MKKALIVALVAVLVLVLVMAMSPKLRCTVTRGHWQPTLVPVGGFDIESGENVGFFSSGGRCIY